MIAWLIILSLVLLWCVWSIHLLCDAIKEIIKSLDELERRIKEWERKMNK